ncbi:Hypothetical predicted protein [Cloeon dipterum]|uniref:Odorant receptor n=1 Tax=Cloeon dipterum TaxID=197152 RepID=A0A8S1DBB2_9INSE|nr:Hypothetical predicted protein [Cloeon dipterum]
MCFPGYELTKEFAIHFKGLALAGFILPNGRNATKFQIFWFVLLWVSFCAYILLTMVEFVVQPYDLRRTLMTIFMANNGIQILLRPMHMLLCKRRVESLLRNLQGPPGQDSLIFDLQEQRMRACSKKRIFKFSAALYFYNTLLFLKILVSAAIRIVKVYCCDGQPQPDSDFCDEESKPWFFLDFWWFTDRFQLPTYYYLFTFNVANMCIYVLNYCSSDAFTCSLIIALVERGDFLVKMAPKSLLPDENGQSSSMFKAWVKYHQYYLSLIKEVNKNIGPLLVVTHVFAALNIMVYFFLILKEQEQEIRVLACFFLFATAIQFFMYAYWGQQVINKGYEISRVTLTASQVAQGAYANVPARSALMIVMTRCCGKIDSKISGMGFFSISLRFYARLQQARLDRMTAFRRTEVSEFQYHFKPLSWCGFILPNGKSPSKLEILRLLSYHIASVASYALTVVHFLVKPYQLRRTIVTMIVLSNGFQTTFRPTDILYRKRKVEKMISDFEDCDCLEFIEKETQMRRKSKKGIVRLSAILYSYNALLVFSTLFSVVIRFTKVAYCDDKRHLNLEFCESESNPYYLYDFYWFTDPYSTPTFYYLYCYNCLVVVMYILVFCTSDAFTCSSLVALAARGEFLIETAPAALMPGERGQLTPMFKAWIKYHQRYENLLQTVNDVNGPIIFVTHFMAAANIMGYLYLIIKDEQEGLLGTVVSFLVATAIQFFFYAYWGQQIINKNDELSRVVLSADQIASGAYSEGPARTALMIINAKCCGARSGKITGLSYFTIGLRFYATIISASATYLLVILQISIREGKQMD